MKLLSLGSAEELAEVQGQGLGVEVFDTGRNDLEMDDGRGGYRPVHPEDSRGLFLIRFDSKEARRLGLKNVGLEVYTSLLA